MGAVGLLLLAAGFWFIYPPLALVVPGAALLATAMVGAARRGRD